MKKILIFISLVFNNFLLSQDYYVYVTAESEDEVSLIKFDGEDAYEKIKAGASALQIYTALIYEGPSLVNKIKKELAKLLENDGFKKVSDAVGIDN